MQRPADAAKLLFRQLFDRTSCTYTYLLADAATRTAVLIDPVDTLIERDMKLLSELDLELRYALNTHAHADHISATGLLKQKLPSLKSVIGKASTAKADILVSAGDTVAIGDHFQLQVIGTPGHTEGCVSYYLPAGEGHPGMVFTGDSLLVRGCGRTDFQGGSSLALYQSVKGRLFTLPGDTVVYPAHDYLGMTASTIAEEIAHNPRLGKNKTVEDFQDIMTNLKLSYPKMFDIAVPANLNCGIPPTL